MSQKEYEVKDHLGNVQADVGNGLELIFSFALLNLENSIIYLKLICDETIPFKNLYYNPRYVLAE